MKKTLHNLFITRFLLLFPKMGSLEEVMALCSFLFKFVPALKCEKAIITPKKSKVIQGTETAGRLLGVVRQFYAGKICHH